MKKYLFKSVILLALFGLSIGTMQAQPANNLCANATNLPCGTSNLAGTTVNTTPKTITGTTVSPYGVWYKFTGDGQETNVSATAINGLSTKIAIFTGSCSSLNFNRAVSNSTNPSVIFTTTNGTQYYVYIAYYDANGTASQTGTFTISRTCGMPANDLCANATNLPCGTNNLSGTTVNTTPKTITGNTASPYGVFYKFTGDGQITAISATSAPTFDAKIVIFSGSCSGLTYVGSDDSGVSGSTDTYTFITTSGTNYFVYIAHYHQNGLATQTGNFTISRTCTPPPVPANNLCVNATDLPCGTTDLAGTTFGATSKIITGNTASPYGVFYKFTGDGQRTTIFAKSALEYDAEIVVFSGSCSGLTYVGNNDSGSSGGTDAYTFTSANGTNYFVYIAYYNQNGSATQTGNFTISRTCTPTYTIEWSINGVIVETDENVEYGTMPQYNGATPTKTSTAQYSYEFTGWSPEIAAVTGNQTYTAQFSETLRSYTIQWSINGTIAETDENVEYGTMPQYNGATPTKTSTAQYSYEFTGWSPEIAAVTGNQTYTAQFSETLRSYMVTFNSNEGTAVPPQTVDYGTVATVSTVPTKTGYDFGGWFTDNGTFLNEWNFENDVVTQDTTLYAKWSQITGINEIASADIQIYPNPVKDELHIESGNLAIKKIEILDITGKVVGNSTNVSVLPQGIYFVKLGTDKGILIQKFIKE